MRNVLLQLHVGHPEACKSWGNVPVSQGLQLTIYTEATSGEPVRIARHLYATGAALTSGKLSAADLADACDAFERWFPHQISRRPRYLDRNLRSALRAAGVPFRDVGLGQVRAQLRGSQRFLAMCPTSPDADDFRQLDELRAPYGEDATLFGAVAAARSGRRTHIDWLEDKSGISAEDEDQLSRYLGLP